MKRLNKKLMWHQVSSNKELMERIIKDTGVLGIKVKQGTYCHTNIYDKIIYLSSDASDYDVAHEISHVICGYSCCREHAEWEAHGGAKILCKMFSVDKKEVEEAEERMGCYAFRTNPEACARYEEGQGIISTNRSDKYVSAQVMLNEFWLEHLLNLSAQGYFGEFWEQIQETNFGLCNAVEEFGYSLVNLIDMKTSLESQKHDAKHENTRLKNEVKNIKNYPKYVQDAEHENTGVKNGD